MTNYAVPTNIGFESFKITPESRSAVTSSPFSYKQQVLTYSGQRWSIDASLPPLNKADADVWRAFFTKLNGRENTFTVGDPLSKTAKGEAGGTPLINGASQTGSSLNVDGCTTSQTDWLKAGDYIQLGTGGDARLFMVTDDVDSDVSGEATINIWPDINVAYADDTAVVVSNTVGAFRLTQDRITFDIDNNSFTKISFSAVSVV